MMTEKCITFLAMEEDIPGAALDEPSEAKNNAVLR